MSTADPSGGSTEATPSRRPPKRDLRLGEIGEGGDKPRKKLSPSGLAEKELIGLERRIMLAEESGETGCRWKGNGLVIGGPYGTRKTKGTQHPAKDRKFL